MKNTLRVHACLAISVLSFGVALPLSAATIYNNTTNDLLIQFNTGTSQIGNEIILAGTDRYLTAFSFEYWGLSSNPSAFAGGANVQARIEFYKNDGPLFNGYASPGTVLFDSSWFLVPAPTSRSTFVFGAADFAATGGAVDLTGISDMTWTVQFRGMGAGDSLGVDLYGPPTVGGNFGDFWQQVGSSWMLTTNSLVPPNASFAADMIAIATIPEPSTVVLSVLGGLGLMAAASRRGRKE
jgi:hypothetical protein